MNHRIAALGALLFTGMSIGNVNAYSGMPDQEKYLTLSEVELYEVDGDHETLVDRASVPAVGTSAFAAETDPPAGTLGDIISLGDKIWKLIDANRPVVTQTYSSVSAVPAGIRSWDELDGWPEPTIRIFRLVYKNLYRFNVVEFEYRVIYSDHGSFQGKGQYLSRVLIEPKLLNVAWGFQFNANGSVVNVTNVGTREAPIAAMDVNMNWSVASVLRHTEASVHYYIRGDGLFKNLSDGSMPSGLK